jgi:hypothetical protein
VHVRVVSVTTSLDHHLDRALSAALNTFNVLPYDGSAYPLNAWRQLLAARAALSKSVKMNQKVSNNVLLLASMAS